MIRLPASEKGFVLALIASAAIHAALLPLFLSFASGSVPGHVRPVEGIIIKAFLVPGAPAAVGRSVALPVRKPRETARIVPTPAVAVRESPEEVAPVEKEGIKSLADIRPVAERIGTHHDAGASPDRASSPAPAVLIPEAGVSSGSVGPGIPAARQGSGEFSRENDADHRVSRRGGMDVPVEGSGVWSMRDADAVPRYGDNAIPAYPPLARLRGYQGVAVLSVEVLADGRVGQVGISRSTGHEILDRTALEAVRSWRFEPGLKGGRPAAMTVAVPVRFVLKGNSTLVRMDDRR